MNFDATHPSQLDLQTNGAPVLAEHDAPVAPDSLSVKLRLHCIRLPEVDFKILWTCAPLLVANILQVLLGSSKGHALDGLQEMSKGSLVCWEQWQNSLIFPCALASRPVLSHRYSCSASAHISCTAHLAFENLLRICLSCIRYRKCATFAKLGIPNVYNIYLGKKHELQLKKQQVNQHFFHCSTLHPSCQDTLGDPHPVPCRPFHNFSCTCPGLPIVTQSFPQPNHNPTISFILKGLVTLTHPWQNLVHPAQAGKEVRVACLARILGLTGVFDGHGCDRPKQKNFQSCQHRKMFMAESSPKKWRRFIHGKVPWLKIEDLEVKNCKILESVD